MKEGILKIYCWNDYYNYNGYSMKLLFLILPLGILFMCSDQKASYHEDDLTSACYVYTSPIPWSYCETNTMGGDPSHLLYYFHGKGGNEKTWLQSNRQIRARWREKGIAAPTVISITFGEKWLLAPKNANPKSGLLDFFWQVVLPRVESNRQHPVKKRSVMGVSMGGYNAAQLLFRRPGLFQKGVLVHPAITTVSPYAADWQIDEYTDTVRQRTKDLKYMIKSILHHTDQAKTNVEIIFETSKTFFPDNASWEESSPLRLIETITNPDRPSLFISCGTRDEFGLFAGAETLATKAREQNMNIIWQPLKGGHGIIDSVAVADFLSR